MARAAHGRSVSDRFAMPLAPHREERVRRALEAALEGLKLAGREASGAAADPARLGWTALGLVTALQAALVAALSGYDTAAIEAVQNPSQPERIAAGSLLLRRASSEDYLNPPERVDLSGSQQRAVERIVAVRNAAVHSLGVEIPSSFASDARVTLGLISHLVLDAPAFDARSFRLQMTFLRDAVDAVRRHLEAIKLA